MVQVVDQRWRCTQGNDVTAFASLAPSCRGTYYRSCSDMKAHSTICQQLVLFGEVPECMYKLRMYVESNIVRAQILGEK